MKLSVLLWAAIVLQGVFAVFFLANLFSALTGLDPLPWTLLEIVEIGVGFGLIVGMALGWVVLRRIRSDNQAMARRLRAASEAFAELVEGHFSTWGLTPAERDVAIYAIKGLSVSDIASLRETSEGTVKAQTNAIYRKAGVSGKPQLLSLFIEDLMDDALWETQREDPLKKRVS